MSDSTKRYLYDGVHADSDGWRIKLTAEYGDKVIGPIYLEWRTMKLLLRYAEDAFDVKIAAEHKKEEV